MSGLLRRLRASSDATPRAEDGTQDAPVEAAPAPDGTVAEPVEAAPTEGEGAQPAPTDTDTDTAAVAAGPAEPLPGEDVTRAMPAAQPQMASGGLPGDAAHQPGAAEPVADADDLVEERPLPAGVAPEDLIGERPDTRRRSRLRRRARHLRHVRELMLRDIGGLVYEIHRAGQDPSADQHRFGLVRGKLEHLEHLDAERRELEATLGLARATTVIREPGVGGACPVCSEYFASDATFCFRCGARVDGRAEPTLLVPAPDPVVAEDPDPVVAEEPPPAAVVAEEPVAQAPVAEEPATEEAAPEPPASDDQPAPATAPPVNEAPR